MQRYNLYRAKKDNTGLAASFELHHDGAFLKLAKQQPSSGENDSFSWGKKGEPRDPKKNIMVSLATLELGQLLSVFNGSQDELALYHEFQPKEGEKVVTNIKVEKYSKTYKNKAGKDVTAKGISLSVSSSGASYGLVLSMADVEVLKVLFAETILMHTYVEFKSTAPAHA